MHFNGCNNLSVAKIDVSEHNFAVACSSAFIDYHVMFYAMHESIQCSAVKVCLNQVTSEMP
uniref:Uncharacterized protein n=1 Tax=Arundo donax TaxID=35708 RepID=A0A0A8Y9Z9_ARUDO